MRESGVFVDQVRVGTLHDTDPLSFTYTQDCINGLLRPPFSALIPLRPGPIANEAVTSFFENLLPEGDERALLQARHHVTTIFGMLSKVGGDTAGAVVILPEGQNPQAADYLSASWDDIAALVHNTSTTEAIAATANSNVSLSGAQHKLLLMLGEDNQPSLPLNASISTHILKPDIQRLKIFSSAINETLIMKLAQACQLPTATVSYLPKLQSCLIQRFDRVRDTEGKLQRLYQADLCQLLDKPSGVKYENDGGPSFKNCYELVKNKSAVPLTDCHKLVQWLFFNLIVGNNDSHAKNLAMLNTKGKLRLAPFYDLMCTTVYSGLSNRFAFKIGQHVEPGKINHEDLCELADSLNINRRIMPRIALDIAARIENKLPGEVAALLPLTTKESNEQIVLERVSATILGNVKKMKVRLQPQERLITK
ncbi:serine/threonine-protein kinase HipA [Oxalobacteraceae bacterium GrIS 2.11]